MRKSDYRIWLQAKNVGKHKFVSHFVCVFTARECAHTAIHSKRNEPTTIATFLRPPIGRSRYTCNRILRDKLRLNRSKIVAWPRNEGRKQLLSRTHSTNNKQNNDLIGNIRSVCYRLSLNYQFHVAPCPIKVLVRLFFRLVCVSVEFHYKRKWQRSHCERRRRQPTSASCVRTHFTFDGTESHFSSEPQRQMREHW